MIFTIAIILHVQCQLKFDKEGNILDDGLNLPSFPKDQKKPKALVAAKSKPKSAKVLEQKQPKGIIYKTFI